MCMGETTTKKTMAVRRDEATGQVVIEQVEAGKVVAAFGIDDDDVAGVVDGMQRYSWRGEAASESAFQTLALKSSSNIHAVEYCEIRCRLRVLFARGWWYEYFGVPAGMVQELHRAASVGSFLHREIFSNTDEFPCYKREDITEKAEEQDE